MAQDQTNKEALFNEVKGSLFEYLVCKEISIRSGDELSFHQSLDKNYLMVLTQQDRMIRQFYPQMLPFLYEISKQTAGTIIEYLKSTPSSSRLIGKLAHAIKDQEYYEADIVLLVDGSEVPVSLKLNKKNAYVNTKSGGVKSFFSSYFPFIDNRIQQEFNQFVDLEFYRMGHELHNLYDLEFQGNFNLWVQRGFSELPGELSEEARSVLKAYYARIAKKMHDILSIAIIQDRTSFLNSLPPLLGFGSDKIVQVVCFHNFPHSSHGEIDIHCLSDLRDSILLTSLKEFNWISSVELEVGNCSLQIRVKPMNKFSTTAIKINCSVKFKRPSSF